MEILNRISLFEKLGTTIKMCEFLHDGLWEYYLNLISPRSKYLWDKYCQQFEKLSDSLDNMHRREMGRDVLQKIIRKWNNNKRCIVNEDFKLWLHLPRKEDILVLLKFIKLKIRFPKIASIEIKFRDDFNEDI
jgi:hypothetical protein